MSEEFLPIQIDLKVFLKNEEAEVECYTVLASKKGVVLSVEDIKELVKTTIESLNPMTTEGSFRAMTAEEIDDYLRNNPEGQEEEEFYEEYDE